MADAVLRYRITADDDSNVVFKKAGDNLQVLDKRFKDTTKGAKTLGEQFEDTKKRAAALRKQFDETGDTSLLKDINKSERDLQRMRGWMKALGHDSDDSSKKLGFFGRTAADAGEKLNRAFPTSSAFANPMILGAAAAGAALVAIPALAAAAGAAVGAAGLGFLALGAFAVRGSKDVQEAAKGLQSSWSGAMVSAGRDTEQHYVKALNILEDSAQHVGPTVKRILDEVTPSTVRLARGFDRLLMNAEPGFEKLGVASADVLDDLARVLPEVGTALGDFSESLSGAAEGGGAALIDTIRLLNNAVQRSGEVLGGASQTWQATMEDQGWQKWLPPVAVARGFNEFLTGADEGQKKAAKSGKQLADAYFEVNRGMGDTSIKGKEILATFDVFSGKSVALAEANVRVADASRRASEALKESKGSLDLHSESGSRAKVALLGLAESYKVQLQAMSNSGAGSVAVEAKYRAQVGALQQLVSRLGVSKSAMNAFIAEVFRMPTTRSVTVTTPHLAATKGQVASFNAEVARIKNRHILTIQERGSIAAAASINVAKRQAEAAEGTYFINIVTRRTTAVIGPRNPVGSSRTSGGVGGIATGGLKTRDGIVLRGLAGGGPGAVRGVGTGTSDSNIWALSNGEFVTRAASVASIGLPAMDFMNRTGKVPAAAGSTIVINVNGPVFSKMQAQNDLVAAIDELKRHGRIT
jgi:hypothetical protein